MLRLSGFEQSSSHVRTLAQRKACWMVFVGIVSEFRNSLSRTGQEFFLLCHVQSTNLMAFVATCCIEYLVQGYFIASQWRSYDWLSGGIRTGWLGEDFPWSRCSSAICKHHRARKDTLQRTRTIGKTLKKVKSFWKSAWEDINYCDIKSKTPKKCHKLKYSVSFDMMSSWVWAPHK